MPRCNRVWIRSVEPAGRPLVELGQAPRWPRRHALFEKAFLHVAEGALHLALALGIASLAGPDLGAAELGEAIGRRVKTEPPSLRCPERPHAVGAQDLGDTADELKEADESLEGVLAVDGAGEPPDAHP